MVVYLFNWCDLKYANHLCSLNASALNLKEWIKNNNL